MQDSEEQFSRGLVTWKEITAMRGFNSSLNNVTQTNCMILFLGMV